jgi:lipopolysaccharide/colanic/teichoic acid biosynthesis glycosyltransferase
MKVINKKEPFILLIGDILFFLSALWVTLLIRYGNIPNKTLWEDHFIPFSFLFAVWALVFFIAGLYEKHTLILKNRLPSIILRAQIINSGIAVLFFYFIHYFGITPKTNLFIDLVFSFGFIYFWRVYIVSLLGFKKREKAILIGSGEEMRELKKEVNGNPRYGLSFVSSLDLDEVDDIDFQKEILSTIYSEGISTVVIDLRNEKVTQLLPHLYNLIFSKVRFIDKYRIYEDIFDRVPLSLVNYNWFLENISSSSHVMYDFFKRTMDISVSVVIGLISLLVYPFVFIAIWLDDKDKIFFIQERVGKGGKMVKIIKFRTMSQEGGEKVTRVGNILRKTRIDELPQLWNVLKGDISLVGPRPELPYLVKLYEKEISYYTVRHLIKPGLSGWAQIHQEKPPKFDVGYDETKTKLSYDLYYIKNRSFMLDIKIALQTIKIILSRSGI